MESDCVKQIILKAASIIRTGGLLRGRRHDFARYSLEDIRGPHCLLGAIDAAVCHIRLQEPCQSIKPGIATQSAVDEVAAVLPNKLPHHPRDTYNDLGYRTDEAYNTNSPSKCAWYSNVMAKTAEDVAVMLEKAAAQL